MAVVVGSLRTPALSSMAVQVQAPQGGPIGVNANLAHLPLQCGLRAWDPVVDPNGEAKVDIRSGFWALTSGTVYVIQWDPTIVRALLSNNTRVPMPAFLQITLSAAWKHCLCTAAQLAAARSSVNPATRATALAALFDTAGTSLGFSSVAADETKPIPMPHLAAYTDFELLVRADGAVAAGEYDLTAL